MAKQPTEIDPEKFAAAVLQASGVAAIGTDDLRASKDALKRYLTAYYLILHFNRLESRYFEDIGVQGFLKLLGSVEPIDWHNL